ncbi:hypothetical protein PRIPAC_88110 [Pristionchus pacificus]|uniref:Uncharacterized protein n=1 Tax=Pristionchus pacificus TaxID=54126 RepID=A0A2A6CWG1_PRIPA|nr:hypothetical protein PRIPAC_88110 [Pristionchus pacificus]|eukprot:PDM82468.1 protein kinase [Pristionchus pacificus]
MTNSECVKSTWRHQLPANTSCYQLEDGTFFLFNEVPPYALCAVVKGRRVDVALPALKEPLLCSGVLGNGLYFYSAPPRRRSFKFYRASVNQDAVEFMKIREVQNGAEPLYIAHCQPFYVAENEGQMQTFAFDTEQGSKVSSAKFSVREIFFQHLKILYRLREGISVAVEQEKYYSSYTVIVTVPDPSKTAVYSRGDSEVLYVIAGDELLIIINHTLAKTFRLQPFANRSIDFSSSLAIVGVHNAQLVFSALQSSTSDRYLWSAELKEQHCDKSAHCNLPPHFPTFIPSKNLAATRTRNLSNLAAMFPRIAQSALTVSKPPKTCYSSSTSNLLVPSKSTPRILPKSTTTIPKSAGIAKQQVSNGSSTTFESSFLKNFKPLKVLGHGSFGWVFEVERNLEGIVKWNRAVKRIALRGSPNAINNVLKEVEAMEKFNHPGIVSFHNAWTEQPPSGWQRESDSILLSNLGYGGCIPHYYDDCSFLYIEMELCQSTLSTWIADNNVRNMSKIKQWFRQIVSAVGYIHSRGKFHRDLKPCNILITSENALKICDLGLITDCQIESGLEKTRTRTTAGTPLYMAPEQHLSIARYTSKADVFALGLILTQLCVILTIDKAIEVFDNYRAGRPNNVLDKYPKVKSLVEWMTKRTHSERPTWKGSEMKSPEVFFNCRMNGQGSSGQEFQSSRFKTEFKPTRFLGNGTYGSVFAAEKVKDTTMKCAVKRIPLEGSENEKVLKQVDALHKLKHERIVSVQDAWFETLPLGWQEQADRMMITTLGITECLKNKNDCSFQYIQMEPSNILFDGSDGLKVCDLGIIADSDIVNKSVEGNDEPTSRTIRKGAQMKRKISDCQPTSINKKARNDKGAEKRNNESSQDTISTEMVSRGNRVYWAPEQMNSSSGNSFKVDMFSLGLILAELCVVMTADEAAEVFDNYRAGKPNNALAHFPDVKDLVDWLTNVDLSDRPNCEELF